ATPVPVTAATGIASFTINNLALGGHTIYAVYSGDSNYLGNAASPASAAFTINLGTTNTTFISETPASPNYGQQVAFVMQTVEAPVISPIYNTLTGNITLLADVPLTSLGLITNVSGNGVPIVITTTGSTAGLAGQTVTIFGVLGNTAANGTY